MQLIVFWLNSSKTAAAHALDFTALEKNTLKMDKRNMHPNACDISSFPCVLYLQPNQKNYSQAMLCQHPFLQK